MTTKVKICGLTSIHDAEMVVAAGADYLGLIFVKESQRCLSMTIAEQIRKAVSGRISIVGVFRNAPATFVAEAARRLALDFVQLHGHESPAYCQSLSTPVIKVLELTDQLNQDSIDQYSSCASYLLFDRPKRTHQAPVVFDPIATLRGLELKLPFFFAGNLSPETVRSPIDQLNPFGIDVASGVEAAPGIKDPDKVRAFCEACRKSVPPA